MWFGIVFGFGILVGALVVLGIEAIVVLAVIERLSQKYPRLQSRNDQLDHNQSLDFSFNKQGVIWILLSSKVPKDWLDNRKAPKEQKRKKEYFEVTPVKKPAKINGQTLILTESDGSKSTLKLKGCTIETVSASHLSSRKWAKRFPLKLENKVSPIYKDCKTLYIFLETSWEKESWCKSLRLAASDNRSRLEWSVKLQKEFRNYLTSLNDGYSSFMKPSSGLYATELSDRTQRNDGSSSKVRTLWKKLAKKASKSGADNRASWPSLSYVEKMGENGLSIGLSKNPSPAESTRRYVEDSDAVLPKLTHSMSQGQTSCVSDADTEERFGIIDEGTLCWNLLISRLFFDSRRNGEMKKSLQARIQRTMSNMRTPSYIGEVICTDIDLGNLPPYVHGMRVLPMDTNEVWAFELDVEYAGSLVLGIETRLEVGELDSERTIVDPDSESNSVEDVRSELLEGFEYLGKQLDLAKATSGESEHKEEGEHKLDRSKSPKASTSRWKSIVNNVAKQVSQVPISLAVRISSLRGTLRIHIKPPPSDQLWFGFTSMPDIDFNLDSAVGDHKITNGQIALFIINRLKGAINETLVLPNCECVGIPFMLADKDDWVPRKVAPFIWVHHDTPNGSVNSRDPLMDHLCEAKPKMEQENEEATSQVVQAVSKPSESKPILSNGTSEDLKEHLLASNNAEESEGSESHKVARDSPECPSTSRSLVFIDKPPLAVKDDAAKPKKMGTRERMVEYRKKVSEKLEEKRRQVEEKSKQMVEKMRGP